MNIWLIEYRKYNIYEEYELCIILVWWLIILKNLQERYFFCNPFTKKIAKKDKGFLLLYMALADQKYINEGNRFPEMETVLEIYKNVIKKV